jgi:formate-dependent nitrite reductase membrane component NrfD
LCSSAASVVVVVVVVAVGVALLRLGVLAAGVVQSSIA